MGGLTGLLDQLKRHMSPELAKPVVATFVVRDLTGASSVAFTRGFFFFPKFSAGAR